MRNLAIKNGSEISKRCVITALEIADINKQISTTILTFDFKETSHSGQTNDFLKMKNDNGHPQF